MESASFMCRQGYKVWLLDCLDCLDDKVVCPSYVPMILDTGFEKSSHGSEWTWTYEKWTGGQSSDYAEAMVGNGVMI